MPYMYTVTVYSVNACMAVGYNYAYSYTYIHMHICTYIDMYLYIASLDSYIHTYM